MNRDKFHVGTKVVKFDKNNNKQIVKVTKIEQVNEPVKYYHVTNRNTVYKYSFCFVIY